MRIKRRQSIHKHCHYPLTTTRDINTCHASRPAQTQQKGRATKPNHECSWVTNIAFPRCLLSLCRAYQELNRRPVTVLFVIWSPQTDRETHDQPRPVPSSPVRPPPITGHFRQVPSTRGRHLDNHKSLDVEKGNVSRPFVIVLLSSCPYSTTR